MANWWAVNKNTQAMIVSGDDAFKESCSIGSDQEWLECPEGIAIGNCKVLDTEGVLSLVEDLDKTSPKWDELRAARNAVLKDCDWTQLSDSPLSIEDKADWVSYRQYLRDIPQNEADAEYDIMDFDSWLAEQE